MNREQLTQVIRGAFSAEDMIRRLEGAVTDWQQETQDALIRALFGGGAAVPAARECVGFAERWEAIRFAIERQSDELHKLRGVQSRNIAAHADGIQAQKESDRDQLTRAIHAGDPRPEAWEGVTWTKLLERVTRLARDVAESRRAELAAALGLTRDELVQESWTNLLARVSKLRMSEKHIEQGAENRARIECRRELAQVLRLPNQTWNGLLQRASELVTGHHHDPERARLAAALGAPSFASWDLLLARVERWRDRYAVLVRLWFGLADDVPAIPSMGNLIRSLEVRNTAQAQRQRAEDAAELREIFGASSQGMNWAGILCRVRDLASLAKAIEAVSHPMRDVGVVTAMAAGPIERGDAVRIVERSPLVDQAKS